MAKRRKSDLDKSVSYNDGDNVLETWSRTEQYTIKASHYWTIVDFIRRAASTDLGNSLCSPVFSVPVEDSDREQNLTFQLEVFPNGEEGEINSDYIAVFLTSRKMEELDVKYEFAVQKADKEPWERIGNSIKKFSPEQNSWGYGRAFSKTKLTDKMNELMPGGKLTIICNLEIYYYDKHTHGKKQKICYDLGETPTIAENMASAFGREEWSDVRLVCGGKKFNCHKIILTSRSDVFAAMFSHPGTEESRTNTVNIEDMEPEALNVMLQFIYSDKVPEMGPLARSLLTAADKYNLPRLKMLSEQSIARDLDISNAVDALILAHLHEADKLKKLAIQLVCKNMKKISESAEWKVVVNSYPSIVNEILVSVTSNALKAP